MSQLVGVDILILVCGFLSICALDRKGVVLEATSRGQQEIMASHLVFAAFLKLLHHCYAIPKKCWYSFSFFKITVKVNKLANFYFPPFVNIIDLAVMKRQYHVIDGMFALAPDSLERRHDCVCRADTWCSAGGQDVNLLQLRACRRNTWWPSLAVQLRPLGLLKIQLRHWRRNSQFTVA